MTVLTPRELEILERASQGQSFKQMGNPNTVKNQFWVIHLKLNAHNTTHAVAIGLKTGVIK